MSAVVQVAVRALFWTAAAAVFLVGPSIAGSVLIEAAGL